MAPRHRRNGAAHQLAAIFTVLAKALGLSFCTYNDESSNVDRAKLGHIGDGNIFEGYNAESLRALHRCGGNMTVPKKTMEHARCRVAERCRTRGKSSREAGGHRRRANDFGEPLQGCITLQDNVYASHNGRGGDNIDDTKWGRLHAGGQKRTRELPKALEVDERAARLGVGALATFHHQGREDGEGQLRECPFRARAARHHLDDGQDYNDQQGSQANFAATTATPSE
jgi:hypothetical protein